MQTRRSHNASVVPRIEVYHDDHSLYCAKILLALKAKRVAFTCLEVPCGGLKRYGRAQQSVVHSDVVLH
jgi:hypothetical protein